MLLVVAAAVLDPPGLLLVSKRAAPDVSFAEVRAPAALEGVELSMSVFLTRLGGVPAPAAEIAALRWWPDGGPIELAPAVRDCVIPRLRQAGRL